MADMQYNFNGLWKGYSQTGNETLSISVYMGNASITMFRKGSDSRQPVVKMNLSMAAIIKLNDIIKQLIDAQPDTRSPFVQMTFNKESRNYEQATNFVFFKDERRCFGVEISNKLNPTPVKIMFKCASTFSTGAESLTEEQKSLLGIREFLKTLELLPITLLLSKFNYEAPQRRGGYGKNKGGGGGNYRSQSRDPYGASGSEEDNVFG